MSRFLTWMLCIVFSGYSHAVPPVLNYAGHVAVNGEAFEGNGLFKFALVDADGATTYWSNDGTSVAGSEPQASVSVTVNGGLYATLLGNTAQSGMGAIDPAVFAKHTDAKLRVWFSDGVNGYQQLSPDRLFASVPYAFSAGTAQNAGSAPIANGTVSLDMLAQDVKTQINTPISRSRLSSEVLADINSTITKERLSQSIKDDLATIGRSVKVDDLDPGIFSFSIPSNTTVTDFGVILISEKNATSFNERYKFNNYGDLKYSFQNGDHSGWIKLDGRLVSTLKDSQALRAKALGFDSNIPDARGSVLMQNDQPMGQITGDNNVTIAKENLPLVDFNGTTDVSGSHTHKFNFKSRATAGTTYSEVNGGTNGGGTWGQYQTTSAGAHDHKVTVSSGGSGVPLNITPMSLSANAFIYLGD